MSRDDNHNDNANDMVGTGLWYGSILRIQDLLSKDDLIAFALITGMNQ